MKIKSKVTGEVIDISAEGAERLVRAGIYDAVTDPKPKEPAKKPDKPTKVEPLTTEDMPTPPKKVA